MSEIKPITPDQVVATKAKVIPPEVGEAFNELIAKNFTKGVSVVVQRQVVDLITARLDVDSDEVFENRWLDIEEIYEEAGWSVVYDKPAYNESYPATFTFKPKNIKA